MATLSLNPPRSQSPGRTSRQDWLEKATSLDRQAREAAERGDLTASARAILESLDCERRSGGLGPQILQLIKPR